MMGSAEQNLIEVSLTKGANGLGFNILGGTDDQYLKGDSGIFITSIRTGSPAAVCNKLQIGDRILKVNDFELVNVTHDEAVRLFRNVKDTVTIKVEKGARKRAMEKLKSSDIVTTPVVSWMWLTVGVILVGFGAYKLYKRVR